MVTKAELAGLRDRFITFLRRKAGLRGEISSPELSVLKLGPRHQLYRFRGLYHSLTGKKKPLDWVIKLHRDTDIRPAPDSALREFSVLQFLHGHGYPVPFAWSVETDAEALGEPFLVMDYVEGSAPDLRPGLTDRFGELGLTRTYQLALQLSHLHHLRGSEHLPLPYPMLDDELSFAALMGSIAEGFAQNPLYAPLQPWCQWILERWQSFPCTGYRLLHGHFTPDDVIVQGEVVKAVLDWGDSLMGDPLFDVAVAELHLRVFYSEVIGAKFIESYQDQRRVFGDPPLDQAALNFYRVIAGLKLMVEQVNAGLPADPAHLARAVEFTNALCDLDIPAEKVIEELSRVNS